MADEIRWAILIDVFGGDPHAWIDYLLQRGSRTQLEHDLPFAVRVAIGGERADR